MPTYEFRCPAGHEFEKFVGKISESPESLPCPTCGEPAARKISGGAGLVFKGSGFYITDYGKDGKKAQRSAPPSDSSAASAKEASTPASESGKADSPKSGDSGGSTSGKGGSSTE